MGGNETEYMPRLIYEFTSTSYRIIPYICAHTPSSTM
jgi:hypothetical protein